MRILTTTLIIAAAALLPAGAQDAGQLMERTRLGATLQNNDLSGTIRAGSGRSKIPVTLFLRGDNIQFRYAPDGKTFLGFHMHLGDDDFWLKEVRDGKLVPFANGKLGEPIAGTDLTFEDLSMRFLYWPDPQLLGEERVDGFSCWKLRIDNPGNSGRYKTMYVWVHKEYGAFMKIEGFDKAGAPLKRFTVEDVMKLSDGTYTLKKMKVSSYQDGRVSGNSYLEFEKPSKPAPGGLR